MSRLDCPPMKLLAFDTSTERMAVALQAGPVRLLRNAPGGAAASATLLPLALTLLGEAGLVWGDLDAIAFGRGPGAFTGLRTSCAAAQGLAAGLGCPVLPIDSLLIVAEDAHAQAGAPADADIGVAMDARMGQIYAGRWRRAQGGWRALEPARLTDIDALVADWSAPAGESAGEAAGEAASAVASAVAGADTAPAALSAPGAVAAPSLIAGSALAQPAWAARLAALQPSHVALGLYPVEADRAAALLRLAVAAWQAGEGLPAAQALPLYLRDKVAQTTAERAQAQAQAQARDRAAAA